jgi:hypothetical protein
MEKCWPNHDGIGWQPYPRGGIAPALSASLNNTKKFTWPVVIEFLKSGCQSMEKLYTTSFITKSISRFIYLILDCFNSLDI